MLDNNVKVLTAKGGVQQISPQLYDYICLTSDKKLYFNSAYSTHAQVLNKIAYFREAKLFDDKPIPLTSSEMRAFYDKNAKNTQEASQLQREVSDLFKLAAAKDASDVHISVRRTECLIKIRTIGDLDLEQEYTSAHGNALCKTIFMTMCDQAGKTFQPKSRQDARMKAVYLPEGITGVRIGTSPTDSGYIMVCRLLKKSDPSKLNLNALGYEPFQIEQINQAKSKKGGINIFAGPTGSGKSTTMSIIVGMIISDSNGRKHVITAENPVEYEIGGQILIQKNIDGELIERKIMAYATQTPVMAGNTKRKKEIFTEAITAMMRLDPDVIMIGEIRDGGSLKASVDASMTGHQVWTSVHATTAIGIIKRLITVSGEDDGGVEKELICDASIVSSLMSQRLVKKLCPGCSEPLERYINKIDPKLLQRLTEVYGDDLSGIKLRNVNGCKNCFKGNVGRTVVAEIINTDQKFMDLILSSNYEAEKYWLEQLNGIPMMGHGLIKVKRGIIDPLDLEDELEYIQIPEALNKDYFKTLLSLDKAS
jgi:type II secretory ATPase GspE/PulE/Tfp pilus assembly ATPase PilB-like protein